MEGDDVRPLEPFDLCPLLDEIVDARRARIRRLRIELDWSIDATGDRQPRPRSTKRSRTSSTTRSSTRPAHRSGSPRARPTAASTIVDRATTVRASSEADRDGIFDRFYRGATRGDVEGSGLGLAIAKRAVERAGGTLVLVGHLAGRHDVHAAAARRPSPPARGTTAQRLSRRRRVPSPAAELDEAHSRAGSCAAARDFLEWTSTNGRGAADTLLRRRQTPSARPFRL